MKSLLLASLLVISSVQVWGQAKISGTVKDQSTQQGIEFVSIAVYSVQDSTLAGGNITDLEGNFSLDGLAQGSYYLVISFLGYQTQTIPNLILARNEQRQLEPIFLTADFQNLQAVDVQGQRIATEFRTEDRKSVV